MRTRFLTDFFTTSTTTTTTTTSSHSLQTLNFLQFPPPDHLNSPDAFTFDNRSCFDHVASFRNIADPQLDSFSVNDALSKFFADVLPQRIDASIDVSTDVRPEEKTGDKLDRDDNSKFTVVTFETPELSISLEDSCLLREEKMQFFFEVADTEVCSSHFSNAFQPFSQDLHDFSLEVQRLMDVQKSIFSVEDISVEFQEEHRPDFFDDASLSKGQISSNLRTFPLLEVDETSLGINSYISEDKHIIFESDEPQQWIQKDESTCEASELLISMEFDVLEHLLNHPPVTCHKFEVPCVNFGTEDDIVNAIDLGDGYSSFKLGPFAFEQFEFVDTNTSHFSEVFFNTAIISEVEPVEQMFGDTSLSTYNRLIVTHEIILRDDSFKSLPVPIISDHEKILSLQAIVDELFMKLKLQSSSTSDGIYLDWHLLEEDISSHNSLKMFENIDTYCIEADMNSCDSQILIMEFILSDTCSNKQTTKEHTAVLNIEMNENLSSPVCRDGIASSKLNVPCQKMASGEVMLGNKVDRSDQRVESMSQFDDLDVFLNPSEATCVKKPKHAEKNPGMDYTLPVNSAKNPIEIDDTSHQQQQSLENEFHPVMFLLCIQLLLQKNLDRDHSTSMLNESSKNSEELLNSTPVNENKTNSFEATLIQAPREASVMEPKKVNRNTPALPDAIIIVNTQNADTGMIISRRTTYQRILAMEKEGVQVVERDLNLPVDVIVSAAVCLVLYDSKNISRKTNSSDSGSSLLSSCIENIAANILTSLSFAFSSCILIFEGEVGFLAGIMESSDELYAAAAIPPWN
ncbi:protein shortage in chiasmata 1 [Tanacetum coccineum]